MNRLTYSTLTFMAMAAFIIGALAVMTGCPAPTPTNPPTSQPTALQQLQQTHDSLAVLLMDAELAYDVALAAGVVPVQDQAIEATADKAANDALASLQTSINAGDTNGAQVALKAFSAALADLNPIIHRAQLAHRAKLKATKK